MTTDIPIDQVSNANPEAFGSGQSKINDIKFGTRVANCVTADDTLSWVEPSSPSHAEYPNDSSERTISGHVFIKDDSPGSERIGQFHGPSGSFYEIHPSGDRVTKIFGDDFEIVLSNKNILISGSRNITVNGDCNLMVRGNVNEKIGGSKQSIIMGDLITRVKGKITTYSDGDHMIQTKGNMTIKSVLNTIIRSLAALFIQSDGNASIMGSNTTIYGTSSASINGNALTANSAPLGAGVAKMVFLQVN